MKNKAVIFDMDGVLVNSEPHHKEIEARILEELGVQIPESELSAYVGIASDELWTKVVHKFKLSNDPLELLKLNNERIIEYFNNLDDFAPIDGVEEIILKIMDKNIPLAVASSSSNIVIDALLKRSGLSSYFDIRVGGQMVEKSKPEPYIYYLTAEKLGVEPQECTVFEDSTNGIKAAKRAGMYCIGYRGIGYQGQDQSEADRTIRQYDEIDLFDK